MPKKTRSHFFIAFMVIFVFLIVLKYSILTAPFSWDALGYVIPSTENFFNNGIIINKTASTGHPPLFFISLAFVWRIFGKTLIVSHLFNIFLGGLGLTFLFFLAKDLYGNKVGVVATLLLSFNQIFFSQIGTLNLSIAVMTATIFSVYSYIKRRYLLYLISTSMMLLAKETTVIVLLSILLFDFFLNLIKKEKIKTVVKKFVLLSLPIIPLLVWFFSHWLVTGWIVNTRLIVNKSNFVPLFISHLKRYLIYDSSIENVNRVNWIIFLLVIIAFVVVIIKRSLKYEIRRRSFKYELLFILVVGTNIALFSYTDNLPRYFLIIFPFYLLIGARGFVMFSGALKYKTIILSILLIVTTGLSVMNYSGTRNTDGWRLESNMEYLDMVRLHQEVCNFIENNYYDYKILTNWPLIVELQKPWYGYVKKPINVISFGEFNKHGNVVVVWSSQSNFMDINRFIELNRNQLELVKYFSHKSKVIKLFKKKPTSIIDSNVVNTIFSIFCRKKSQLKNVVNYGIMCDFKVSTWIHLIDSTLIISYCLN